MRLLIALLLMAAALPAQEESAPEEETKKPEPGPVDLTSIRLRTLVIPSKTGDAQDALRVFLIAHFQQKRGETDAALNGYLEFRGMKSAKELPKRYRRLARERSEELLRKVRDAYRNACALYRKDRTRGLASLLDLSRRFERLPEGTAADVIWQSDRLLAAIDESSALERAGERVQAAGALETAVRRYRKGLYLYAAKKRLVELGGPDLFEAHERPGAKESEEDETETEPEEDSVIEESEPTPK